VSRLTELQEKYAGTDPSVNKGCDPYPFAIGDSTGWNRASNRYNNGGTDLFHPRAGYEQDWDRYNMRLEYSTQYVVAGQDFRNMEVMEGGWVD
jgi:hypothetical protein